MIIGYNIFTSAYLYFEKTNTSQSSYLEKKRYELIPKLIKYEKYNSIKILRLYTENKSNFDEVLEKYLI